MWILSNVDETLYEEMSIWGQGCQIWFFLLKYTKRGNKFKWPYINYTNMEYSPFQRLSKIDLLRYSWIFWYKIFAPSGNPVSGFIQGNKHYSDWDVLLTKWIRETRLGVGHLIYLPMQYSSTFFYWPGLPDFLVPKE
jgi:hypothetical protein